jgi:cytochrome b
MPAEDRKESRHPARPETEGAKNAPARAGEGAEQGPAPKTRNGKGGKRPADQGAPGLGPKPRERREVSGHASRGSAGRLTPSSRGASLLRPRGILLSIPVWDLPLRLFHWLLVLDVMALYGARLAHKLWGVPMTLHYWCGLFALSLILFRWLWGFWGSETARFSRFLRPPREALAHLRALFVREPDTVVGHNPAGGYMVLLLLLLLTLQAVSGLFARSGPDSAAPYSALLTPSQAELAATLHSANFVLLLGAIGLHVAAILLYQLVKGQNLVGPMITGKKRLPAATPPPRLAPITRALLLYLLSAAVVGLIAWAAPDRTMLW